MKKAEYYKSEMVLYLRDSVGHGDDPAQKRKGSCIPLTTLLIVIHTHSNLQASLACLIAVNPTLPRISNTGLFPRYINSAKSLALGELGDPLQERLIWFSKMLWSLNGSGEYPNTSSRIHYE